MRVRCVLMAAAMLLLSVPAAAQTRTLTGSVTDASTGQPLEGARVSVRGTSLAATTGAAGVFTLGNLPTGGITINIRRIGSNPVEIVLPPGQNEIRVTLTRDPLRLSDVVVTGQATGVERRNLANAVATVSGEEVSRVSAQTVEQALQGKVVGASIQANSGAPGGGMQMRLRGVTSINGASEPLYVVDDTPLVSGHNGIVFLNPNDIAKIEVLKNPADVGVYGVRGSNGVIKITTKKPGR